MQPKLYVTNYPAGDFRAMPALGGGHALLKWVTSFPGNPARGLPTVSGLVVLSDAETGLVEAVLDAGAVTALRTGAAAALAAETLGRAGRAAAVVGAGVNGRAAARSPEGARPRRVALGRRPRASAGRSPPSSASASPRAREDALAADVVVTVTPGKEILLGGGLAATRPARQPDGRRRARQGGDRRRRDRRAYAIFCDEWEQASHGGELAAAVEAGAIGRDDVTELGAVLDGRGRGPPLGRRDHALRLDRARDPGSRDRDRRVRACGRARADPDRPLGDEPRRLIRSSSGCGSPAIACATRSPHISPSTLPCPE